MRCLLLIAAMTLSGMAWCQPGSVIRLTNPFYNKVELLAETPPIDHPDWREYAFVLQPLKSYTYLFLAAEHREANVFYNGHILVDHLSDLKWTACDDW